MTTSSPDGSSTSTLRRSPHPTPVRQAQPRVMWLADGWERLIDPSGPDTLRSSGGVGVRGPLGPAAVALQFFFFVVQICDF